MTRAARTRYGLCLAALLAGCGNDMTYAEGYDELQGASEAGDAEASASEPGAQGPEQPVDDPADDPAEDPIDDPVTEPDPLDPAPAPDPTPVSCEDDNSCDVCPAAAEETLTEFAFLNIPQLERSGAFRVEFVTRVSDAAGDAFIALSLGDMDFFDDPSAMVRFAPEGVLNARDGDQFAADVDVPFSAGQWYYVLMDVDPAGRLYDVWVRECDGPAPTLLIEGAAFRSDRPEVTVLDTFGMWTEGTADLEVAGIRWN